jgi:hypothetical protein
MKVFKFIMAHFAHDIRQFINFWTSLLDQCGVIDHFKDFKKDFPQSFIYKVKTFFHLK